jgi:hypothetical protein
MPKYYVQSGNCKGIVNSEYHQDAASNVLLSYILEGGKIDELNPVTQIGERGFGSKEFLILTSKVLDEIGVI